MLEQSHSDEWPARPLQLTSELPSLQAKTQFESGRDPTSMWDIKIEVTNGCRKFHEGCEGWKIDFVNSWMMIQIKRHLNIEMLQRRSCFENFNRCRNKRKAYNGRTIVVRRIEGTVFNKPYVCTNGKVSEMRKVKDTNWYQGSVWFNCFRPEVVFCNICIQW